MTGSTSRFAAAAVLLATIAAPAAAQTEAAGIGLAEAITTAEEDVQGRAFEAELESEDGRAVYEIKIADAERNVHEVEIDAETGEILSREQETLEGFRKRWLNADELDTVLGAERGLAEIVAAVEAESGATAQEAEVDTDDARVVYEIELTGAEGEEIEAEVAAMTGEMIELKKEF